MAADVSQMDLLNDGRIVDASLQQMAWSCLIVRI